jgi:putative membrane protein
MSEAISTKNDKTIKIVIWVATVLVCGIVVILNRKIIPVPSTIPAFIFKLPALNAFINGTCSVLLVFSLLAIRKKNIALHKRLNLTAFLLSTLFLLSYVTAHYFIPDTRFGDIDHNGVVDAAEYAKVSGIKPVYLTILLSHIVLAVIVLPLVLLSFHYGLTDQREKHRKLTRFSYPVWLYVTITGVVVYLMISPYYNY